MKGKKKKRLHKVVAFALAVAMVASNIASPMSVFADDSVNARTAETQSYDTDTDGSFSTDQTPSSDVTTEFVLPESTSESSEDVSTATETESTEASTEAPEGEDEEESSEEDADPLPEQQLEDYSNYEGTLDWYHTIDDIIYMADRGLNLDTFIPESNMLHGISLDEFKAYKEAGLSLTDVVLLKIQGDPNVLEVPTDEDATSADKENFISSVLRVLQPDVARADGGYYVVTSAECLNSGNGAYWNITMYNGITALCLDEGLGLNTGDTLTASTATACGVPSSDVAALKRCVALYLYMMNHQSTFKIDASTSLSERPDMAKAVLQAYVWFICGYRVQPGNAYVSPYGVSNAFLLAYSGNTSPAWASTVYRNANNMTLYYFKNTNGQKQDLVTWSVPTIREEYYASAFRWQKTDAVTGGIVTDAKFAVQQWNGSAWETMQSDITYNGTCYQSEGLKLYFLPNANKEWRIIETDAGATHKLPDTADHVVWYSGNVAYTHSYTSQADANAQAVANPVDLTGSPFVNMPNDYTAFEWTKTDWFYPATNVTDAVFALQQWNGSGWDNMQTDIRYNEQTGKYQTDAFLISTGNGEHKWRVVETSAGSTHQMPTNAVVAEMSNVPHYNSPEEATANRYNVNGAVGQIRNKDIMGRVIINKADVYSGASMNNVTFEMQEQNGNAWHTVGTLRQSSDKYTYSLSGVVVKELDQNGNEAAYVDENGVTVSGLVWWTPRNQGNFRIVEKRVTGYSDGQRVVWSGHLAGQMTWDPVTTEPYEVKNTPFYGYVQIAKVDSQTGNAIKSNATFTVYEYDVATGAYKETTGANKITFTRNSTSDKIYRSTGGYKGDGAFCYQQSNGGKYKIVETSTPSGYIGNYIAAGNFTKKVEYYVRIVESTASGKAEYDAATHTLVIPDKKTGKLANTAAMYWTNSVDGNVIINEAVWGRVEVFKQDAESGLSVGQQAGTLSGATYGLIPAANIAYPDGQSNVYTGVTKATVQNLLTNMHLQEAVANDTSGKYTDAQIAAAQAKFETLSEQLDGYCVASCEVNYDEATGKTSGVMIRKDLAGTVDENKLYLGQYYLVEIHPSEGYLLSTKITDITLNYQNDKTIEIAASSTESEQVKKQAFQFAKLANNDGDTELYPLDGAEFRVISTLDLDRIDGREQMTDAELVAAVLDKYKTPEGSTLKTSIDLSMVESALVYNENDEGGLLVPTGNPNEYRVATLKSGTDGFVHSPELPYGRYLVYESVIPMGKDGVDKYKDINPFVVTVTKDGVAFESGSTTSNILISQSRRTAQKMRYFSDDELQAYLKIVKRDTDTQLEVLQNGASYKVWSVERQAYVSTKVFYPTEYVIDTYTTNDNGYLILPQSIPAGKYILEEVKAPKGYVRVGFEKYYDITTGEIVDAPERKLEFEISTDTEHYIDAEGNNVLVCVIYQYNQEQKGALEIYKEGEVVVGVNTYDYSVSTSQVKNLREDVNAVNKQFVYEKRGIPGVSYELHVGENPIYTLDNEYDWDSIFRDFPQYADYTKAQILALDPASLAELLPYRNVAEYGGVKLDADALVATLTTDADGYARIGDLPVGHYYVVETATLGGFILDETPNKVEFDITDDDTQAILLEKRTFENERKKFEITGVKKDADSNEGVSGAVFGIYANADIYDYTGTNVLIPKDELIETIVTGEDGTAKFNLDAPYGANLRVVEIASPYLYINNDASYSFETTDVSDEDDNVKKTVVNDTTSVTTTIFNKKYGYISVSKLSFSDETVDVPGATLTLIYHNPDGTDEVIDKWVTDGKEHVIEKEFKPGSYTLVEERTPNGYYTAESIDFEVNDDLSINRHYTMYDREADARIKVLKLDRETLIPLKGVHFQLLDEDGNVCEDLITDENGEAVTENSYPLYVYKNGKVVDKKKYTLHEVDSVFGYHVIDTDVPVPDAKDWDEVNPIILNTIYNGPNIVKISKTSATTGKEIKGAILTVIEKSTGKIVDSWETNGEAHVIRGMDEGTFILREKRAAFGYVVAADVEFEVKDSVPVTKVNMIDEEALGILKIKKVNTSGNPLPGTTFVIKDEGGNVVDTLVCGDDGMAESKPLPAFIFDADGTYLREIKYTLQETKAADGYILDTTEFPFTFTYVNDQTPFIYRSAKITNMPGTPKTGDSTMLFVVITILMLSLAVGVAAMIPAVRMKRATVSSMPVAEQPDKIYHAPDSNDSNNHSEVRRE